MNNDGGYPLGAKDDPKAPYNKKENPEVELTIDIWKTVHKQVKVLTSDYEVTYEGKDEDGFYEKDLDFSNADVYSLIKDNLEDKNGWETIDFDYSIEQWN